PAHAAIAVGETRRLLQDLHELPRSTSRVRKATLGISFRELTQQIVERLRRPEALSERRQAELALRDARLVQNRISLEETPTRSELPEHHAEGVHIGGFSAGDLSGDLRSDVTGLGVDYPRHRPAATIFSARCAEVDQLQVTCVTDHHVLGAEISVSDLERNPSGVRARVNMSERVGEPDPNRDSISPTDTH